MILITGANGFIGSALVTTFNHQGREDLLLCDRKSKLDQRNNLKQAKYQELFDVAELFNKLETKEWAKKVDCILHIGACADTTELDVTFLNENNVIYSKKLCEWALKNKARFIYASSAAVYGDGELGFSDSDDLTPKLKPLNPYGKSKWEVDKWVIEQGLINQVVGLRFFNVFGPNEYHKEKMASVIYRTFPETQKTGKIKLFKSHKEGIEDGEQLRDFIYVKDVIKAIQFFMQDHKANGIFNIGTGQASSFNQLGTYLLKALGKEPHIEYFDMPEELRPRYQYFTQADISRLRAAGFQEPFQSFESSVADYVQNYLIPGKSL